MFHKNLLMSIIILIPGISYNSFENSLDFSHCDDGYTLALPTLTLKQIAALVLHNGLTSLFQPKTVFYALGLVGCLTGSKLLYSTIKNTLSIDTINIYKDIKSAPKQLNEQASHPKFPYANDYYHC